MRDLVEHEPQPPVPSGFRPGTRPQRRRVEERATDPHEFGGAPASPRDCGRWYRGRRTTVQRRLGAEWAEPLVAQDLFDLLGDDVRLPAVSCPGAGEVAARVGAADEVRLDCLARELRDRDPPPVGFVTKARVE